MRAVLTSLMLLLPLPAQADEVQLLMGEEAGCYWCGRWTAEIGAIYPKTKYGEEAPLWRIDIHEPLPAGIRLDSRIVYTPTFVLLVNGEESGRIEGYPGEDFFWGLLAMLMEAVDVEGEADAS
ncbi:MAG: hypothetical protein AAGF78_12705 [Pseudomonadota bacterium]